MYLFEQKIAKSKKNGQKWHFEFSWALLFNFYSILLGYRAKIEERNADAAGWRPSTRNVFERFQANRVHQRSAFVYMLEHCSSTNWLSTLRQALFALRRRVSSRDSRARRFTGGSRLVCAGSLHKWNKMVFLRLKFWFKFDLKASIK